MKVELMAPAGNLSSFVAAVNSGADSVYLGLNKFNARRPAQNFAPYIMKKVVNYAHEHNCKVYVTLNIALKSGELSEACSMLQFLRDVGVDAVIATDLAVIDLINKFFPQLELHFSTQTVIHNSLEVQFAAKQGAKRVVLARELTLEEISKCVEMAKKHNVEIEIFTEGSMCFCISGRCLMSSFIGGRSGNRGACTGCCRIKWTDSNGNSSSVFSMKDLSLAEHLPEIVKTGVSALKIEGRLKKSGWVQAITGIYRDIIDEKKDVDISQLSKYTAREVGTGHVYGHDNIVGNNENWQNYIKTNDDIDIPEIFEDKLRISVECNEKIKINIDYRGQKTILEENLPHLPKKAKTVDFNLIIDKLYADLTDFDADIDFQGQSVQCGLSYLNNLSEKIKKLCEKLQNDSDKYPEVDSQISQYIKQNPVTRQRVRKLGTTINKVIIRESQLQSIKKAEKISQIVVYLEPNQTNDNILKNANKDKLIVALPEMIYEHEIQYYKTRIETLVQSGLTDFEANSWTGVEILADYNVQKHAGCGLSIMNHKAADYLQRLGFISCYLSCEGDISVYKAASSFISGDLQLNMLEFSKVPLFISRVGQSTFANQKFHDKYIELTAKPIGDVNYFTADSSFSLVDKQTLNDNIFTDNLVADLRFFENVPQIIDALLNGKNLGKVDSFNYRRKLV